MAKVVVMAMGLGEDTRWSSEEVVGNCYSRVGRKMNVAGGHLLLLCRSPEEEDLEGKHPEREERGDVRRMTGEADDDRRASVGMDPGDEKDSIRRRKEEEEGVEVVRRMGGKRQEEGNVGVLRPDTVHAAEVLRPQDTNLEEVAIDAAGDQKAGIVDKEKVEVEADEDKMDGADGLKVAEGRRGVVEVGKRAAAAVVASTETATIAEATAAAAGPVGVVVGLSLRRVVWRRSWGRVTLQSRLRARGWG